SSLPPLLARTARIIRNVTTENTQERTFRQNMVTNVSQMSSRNRTMNSPSPMSAMIGSYMKNGSLDQVNVSVSPPTRNPIAARPRTAPKNVPYSIPNTDPMTIRAMMVTGIEIISPTTRMTTAAIGAMAASGPLATPHVPTTVMTSPAT